MSIIYVLIPIAIIIVALALVIFFWAELLWPGGSVPSNLALAITLYGLVTCSRFTLRMWLREELSAMRARPYGVRYR